MHETVLRAGAVGWPWRMGQGGSGWGAHVHPWLIHVNEWQKPPQYCKVISLQLKKKKAFSLEEKLWPTRRHIKKQRHYFADKVPPSQSYGFSSSHIWMWELDYQESWALKNWCFQTVVLEKTLERLLDCKEIQPVHSKGNQSWLFIERTDAEAPIVWPPEVVSQLIGKDPDAEKDWRQEKGMTEDEMVGWHHQLDGHEFEQAPGVGDGQRGLVCCSPWGHRVGQDWVTEAN